MLLKEGTLLLPHEELRDARIHASEEARRFARQRDTVRAVNDTRRHVQCTLEARRPARRLHDGPTRAFGRLERDATRRYFG